jgi:hypothetical protein
MWIVHVREYEHVNHYPKKPFGISVNDLVEGLTYSMPAGNN